MRAILVSACLLLSACAYPTATVQQGGKVGELYFPKAQKNAEVEVDGKGAGLASSYTATKTLAVQPGMHRVVVKISGQVLSDQQIYIDAGAKIAVGG